MDIYRFTKTSETPAPTVFMPLPRPQFLLSSSKNRSFWMDTSYLKKLSMRYTDISHHKTLSKEFTKTLYTQRGITIIGAQAAVLSPSLLNRYVSIYQTYLPTVKIIAP
jgi:hypothetical protein